ncbi:MAG: YcjX family protein [Candidatus Cloacimonetes bacterium]|nr:YcjX family protein [Candidatus Cloacimonadota bacterium]
MGFYSDQKIRLGVTGLSRSGKTVFLTSLVHQLLRDTEIHESIEASRHRMRILPFFDAVNQERLLHVSLDANPHKTLPPFRYERFARSLLSDHPEWPDSTSDISFLRLNFHFISKNGWHRTLFGQNILSLEIVDYPGEWLLDLPLLSLSFAEWSAQMLVLFEEKHRRNRSVDWLKQIGETNPSAPANPAAIQELRQKFAHSLKSLKYDGFSFLQPGRFVMPGDLAEDSDLLAFCPLPYQNGVDQPGTLYSAMQKNYQLYCQKLVKPFYKDWMAGLDRQIVLVDLLENLNRGHDHFCDTQEALKTILKHFRHGSKGWLDWLNPSIDKVLFTVTKIDHVGPLQAHNCRLLLEDLLHDAMRVIGMHGVECKTEAISSLVSSHFYDEVASGVRFQKVVGQEGKDRTPVSIYPGEVPQSIPSGKEWQKIQDAKAKGESFCFPTFNPPLLESRSMPHIHLDKVIQFLLGDNLK